MTNTLLLLLLTLSLVITIVMQHLVSLESVLTKLPIPYVLCVGVQFHVYLPCVYARLA